MNPAFFSDNTALLALLERWAEHAWLRALDVAFASFLAREEPAAPPLLILAAALASHQLGRGHACLDLAHTLADPGFALSLPPEGADNSAEPLPLPAVVLDGVNLAGWQQALQHPPLVSDGAGDTPLVRVGNRLYLRRYWQYEQSVRAGIDARLAALQKALTEAGAHPRQLADMLPLLQGDSQGLAELALVGREALWQLQAIVHAVQRRWPQLGERTTAADAACADWCTACEQGLGGSAASQIGL